MITRFKSALNQVKAEEILISKTELYLRNELAKKRAFSIPKKLAIAALIALIFIGGGAYYQTPASYLSLDINPSIELGVNFWGKVVKAEGYNKEGKAILSGIDVKGSSLTEAVNDCISSAVDNNFVAKDGSTVISITSVTDNVNTADKIKSAAENGANEALKEKGKIAVIYKDSVSLSSHDEAKAIGITPGKLNLINKLKEVESNVSVDQYKDASVTDMVDKLEKNTEDVNVNTDKTDLNNEDKVEDENKTIDSGIKEQKDGNPESAPLENYERSSEPNN
ncbi:MAG: hypothetical protein ACM3X7_08425 [Solirubrobacterales bacterium]